MIDDRVRNIKRSADGEHEDTTDSKFVTVEDEEELPDETPTSVRAAILGKGGSAMVPPPNTNHQPPSDGNAQDDDMSSVSKGRHKCHRCSKRFRGKNQLFAHLEKEQHFDRSAGSD